MIRTLDDFIRECNVIHNYEYGYEHITQWQGMSSSYQIECRRHGLFHQIATNHRRGGRCPNCTKEALKNKRAYATEEWFAKAQSLHGSKYDYSLFKGTDFGSNTKVQIICPSHGVFHQRATNHISYGTGCPQCSNEKPSLRLGKDEIIARCVKTHNNRYDYSYVGEISHTLEDMKVVCPEHGHFMIKVNQHMNGAPCHECRKIIGNTRKQNRWLNTLGLPNDSTHREVRLQVNDGIRKGYLKVDGFNPLTNTVYEFWGDLWHGNPQVYPSDFVNKKNGKTMRELYQMTLEKRQRIMSAGFTLVEIWEKDWDERNKE